MLVTRLRFMMLGLLAVAVASSATAKWVWTPETGWFRVEKEIRGSPEQNFENAKKLMEDGDYAAASRQFALFARAFPRASYAEEARYLAGEAAYLSDDLAKAHKLFNSYLGKYAQGSYRDKALSRQFDIGCAFLDGQWRRVVGLKIMPPLDLPEKVFSDIMKASPYSDLADDAQLKLGEFYLSKQRYDEAEAASEKLVVTWPRSELVPLARYHIAVANMLRSQGESYDPSIVREAAETLKDYRARYGPRFEGKVVEELLLQLLEGQAVQRLRIARFYLKRKKPEAARIYFESTISEFPETSAANVAAESLEFMLARKGSPGEIAKFLDERIRKRLSGGSEEGLASSVGGNREGSGS